MNFSSWHSLSIVIDCHVVNFLSAGSSAHLPMNRSFLKHASSFLKHASSLLKPCIFSFKTAPVIIGAAEGKQCLAQFGVVARALRSEL